MTIYEGNRVGNSKAVIHHSEITKTARECQFAGGMVQVKYGIAGRVLLGPKGKPGPVTLPATMLVLDKSERQGLTSEPFTLSVTITTRKPDILFRGGPRCDHPGQGGHHARRLQHHHRV